MKKKPIMSMENQFKKGEVLYGVFVLGDPGEEKKPFTDESGREVRVQKVEYFAPSYFGVFSSRVVLRENLVDIDNCMLFKKLRDANAKKENVEKNNRLKLYDDVQTLKAKIEKIEKSFKS